MVVPPALAELRPGIPRQTSDAILRGSAKNPAERFDNCVALAQEVLAAAHSVAESSSGSAMTSLTSRGEPGRVPCPACQAPLPVGREHAGGRVCCTQCHATSLSRMARQP
jgi:hypothetical protein